MFFLTWEKDGTTGHAIYPNRDPMLSLARRCLQMQRRVEMSVVPDDCNLETLARKRLESIHD